MRRRLLLVSAMARAGRARLAQLERDGFELVERFDLDSVKDPDVLAPALEGVWGTVAGSEGYSRELLERTPGLRVIARCGVGYDAVDVPAATARGVAVVITPNANSDAVADFALALVLACLRRVVLADRYVREGAWRPAEVGRDLAGATVGIVGLGTIGRGVARRLTGFGCRLLATEPAPDVAFCRELGIELLSLDELLPQVDVLTLHTPLLPGTRHLIGAAQLARMRPDAIVVNTSRGGVVDEAALLDALRSGRLAGAGLDVFEQEPLRPDHPLARLDNVVLGGHVSAFSRGAVERTLEMVCAALHDVAAGRVPAGCVNPAFADAR